MYARVYDPMCLFCKVNVTELSVFGASSNSYAFTFENSLLCIK